MSKIIYLDHNATTPPAPEVVREMVRSLKHTFGNPSSSHQPGALARESVETARKQVARLINAKPRELIFTSGGTEANNMAILGTALRFSRGHIISSSIEHPSVANPLDHLEQLGFRVTRLPVDAQGIIDPSALRKRLRKDTILITIMHSNNETGSLQPIAEIGELARENNVVFHCDAAQSAGKVPVNVKRLKVDLLTIVSHKFYGPKGVGALYLRETTELKPILFGASHERGLRPGTENVAAIAGLGKAAELGQQDMPSRVSTVKQSAQLLFSLLRDEIPGIKLNGHPAKRLPNTLNISFPGIFGSAVLERLKYDIAASTGSACHEGKHTPSPVLKAMGLSDSEALSAVRLSLGIHTSERQVRTAARAIVRAYRSL